MKINFHQNFAEGKTFDRLIGFWDNRDKMFYYQIQSWNEKNQRYEIVATFQSKKSEVTGLKQQWE